MITKETCVKIYNCWEQIENCEKLMKDMAEIVAKDKERQEPRLSNAFGDRVGLQLGVPSGDSGHRIFGVSIDLSVKIIEQHVEVQKKRLKELEAIAKIELSNENID